MNMQAPNAAARFSFSALSPAALALLGFFFWSCGDAAIRALQDLPVPVVIFGYAATALSVMTVLSKPLGGFRETFRCPRLGLRVTRGGLLVISNILAVITFTHLNMATAYALIFLAPFMAKISGFLLMGERPPARAWLLSTVAFAGVLLILRPGTLPLNIGSMAAMALTAFFALGYTMGRYIGAQNQTPLSTILFQYAFLALGSLPFAWPHFASLSLSWGQLAALLLMGGMNVLGTLCSSAAFTRAPAASVAPLHYSQMIWGIMFGLVLFGETPDGWTLAGAAVIIASGLLLIRAQREKPAPEF